MTASPPPEVAAVLAEVVESAREAHWRAWSLNDAERNDINDARAHNDHMTAAVLAVVSDALTAAGLVGGGTREVSDDAGQ